MNPATVDESPSRRRPWWQNNYVIYDIVMSVLLIGFNVATFLYIRHYKIPIILRKDYMIEYFVALYCVSSIVGAIAWVYMFKKVPERTFEGGLMSVGHLWGVIILILFLYSISHMVALIFGVYASLWALFYSMFRHLSIYFMVLAGASTWVVLALAWSNRKNWSLMEPTPHEDLVEMLKVLKAEASSGDRAVQRSIDFLALHMVAVNPEDPNTLAVLKIVKEAHAPRTEAAGNP